MTLFNLTGTTVKVGYIYIIIFYFILALKLLTSSLSGDSLFGQTLPSSAHCVCLQVWAISHKPLSYYVACQWIWSGVWAEASFFFFGVRKKHVGTPVCL